MASARIGIGISAVYALAILASPSTAQTSGTTSRSIPDAAITKAEALVARMTLDEKLPQLLNVAPAIPRLGIPRRAESRPVGKGGGRKIRSGVTEVHYKK